MIRETPGENSPRKLDLPDLEKSLAWCARTGDMRSARAVLRLLDEQTKAREGSGFGYLVAGLFFVAAVACLLIPEGTLLPPGSGRLLGAILFGSLGAVSSYVTLRHRHVARIEHEDGRRLRRKACQTLEEIVESPRFAPELLDAHEKETVRLLLREVPGSSSTLARLLGLNP